MVEKLEREANVEGLGEVHKVYAPFDQALIALRQKGIKYPISGRDLAFARIQTGERSSLSINGNRIREGCLSAPKSPVLFARNSPILTKQASKDATQSHRSYQEYFFDIAKYKEQAFQDKNKEPEQRRVLIYQRTKFNISTEGYFNIPTDRFSEEELPLWLFRDQAENYGQFLRDAGIREIPVRLSDLDYIDKQKSPFARQLWLLGLDGRSGLYGGRCLYYYVHVRGVKKTPKVSRAEKITPSLKHTKSPENHKQ